MKYTVYAYKSKSTYVNHGVRTPEGGSYGTVDAGWSLKMAIRYELNRLPKGTDYQIEINGKIQP